MFICLFFVYLCLCQCTNLSAFFPSDSSLAPFSHGVASGDPLPDRVIIWTRLTTDKPKAQVQWRVAEDTAMQHIVASGSISTNAQRDYTVKVDVQGLAPHHYYYYEFQALGKVSLRGRTRTAPAPGSSPASLRFGVVSCANYANGYFNVYRDLAERNDVDAIIHLGDYLYEYGNKRYGDYRSVKPDHELVSLADYRQRHAHYKRDPDLRRLHQQYPFIAIWDDHEIANDAWRDGAKNHDSRKEGAWPERKKAATQAYLEWMPLRVAIGSAPIYRKFRYGKLLDLYLLDTRLAGRSQHAGTFSTDSSRTLLGEKQRTWWLSNMAQSEAKWQVVAQQVMMAPMNAQPLRFLPPIFANEDQWDGYAIERERLFQSLQDSAIENMVVLTGDIHSAWAQDLPTANYDPISRTGTVGVEMVVSSVTSQGFDRMGWLGKQLFRMANPHNHYTNLIKHGYLILDVNAERVQGDWYFVNTIQQRDYQAYFEAAYTVKDGQSALRSAKERSQAQGDELGIAAPKKPRLLSKLDLDRDVSDSQEDTAQE